MPNADETVDPRAQALEGFAVFLGLGPQAGANTSESGAFRELWTRSGLSAAAYASSLARFLGLEVASFEAISSAPSLADAFSARFLREFGAYPFLDASKAPSVAIAEPVDSSFDRAAQIVLGQRPRYVVATYDEVAALLAGRLDEAAAQARTDGEAAGDDDVESLRDLASGAPVVRALNDLFERAVEARATDLHIEPMQIGRAHV